MFLQLPHFCLTLRDECDLACFEQGVGAVKGIGQAHESSRAEPVGDRPAIFNSKDA